MSYDPAFNQNNTSHNSNKKYDVFINFRGEDTRKTFTADLHKALLKENIDTYIDYNLKRGDDVGPALQRQSFNHVCLLLFFLKSMQPRSGVWLNSPK